MSQISVFDRKKIRFNLKLGARLRKFGKCGKSGYERAFTERDCEMTQKQVDMKTLEEAGRKLLPKAEVKINGQTYRMDRDRLVLQPLSSKILFVCLIIQCCQVQRTVF
jgi:hypothetical protein